MDITKRAQSRVIKVIKGLRHLSPSKRLRELSLLVLEKTKGGFYSCIQILDGKVHRGQRQALLSGLQGQDQGQQAQTETLEVPCDLSYCECDQALAQLFQKDCGVGDIQCWRYSKAF